MDMIKSWKVLSLACIAVIGMALGTQAQSLKKVTLEDVFKKGTFNQKSVFGINWMKDGQFYSSLVQRGGAPAVVKINLATGEEAGVLLDGSKLGLNFSSYSFNADESKALIATDVESIYRRSSKGIFYVVDMATGQKQQLMNGEKISYATLSPDNDKVAFVKDNDLFMVELASNKLTQITQDGEWNKVINGAADWVYEEEFSMAQAFKWSPDGKKIAFIRFDETQVPEFNMQTWGPLYPQDYKFKYPKAGEKNAIVSLHIFDLKSGTTKKINLGDYKDFYIPRIKWTNDAATLSVQVMNRHQNNLDLHFVDANAGTTKIVLNEKDAAYVDVTDNLTFLKDNSFIWTSEKDGFNHIYHYDKSGKLKKQITSGKWEVTNYYGFDEKSGMVYYQSVENGSINRDVYAIKVDGKSKVRLSSKTGTNSATFSPNFQYFINTYSSATSAPTYTLNDSKTGAIVKTIVSNEAVEQKLAKYDVTPKEFFVLTTEKGHQLNAWMIKPKNFDPNKKYPVFMFQYSGPGSQQVANTWNGTNDYWFMMLAQQGYIVACVDGRGTGFKGAAFKKCTQKELGKYEVEDQIDAAKVIGKYNYVDASRIGIFGWSYGGFMSSNCLFQGADVFKMAIAVAPVTSWRYYDSIYTERYMQTPQENASGYDNNSPINHVSKLKGDFLLIHGTADDNVHVQNTMKMVEALVQANKQFDWAIYPDKNHGIYGGKTRLQLYTKMTNFIKEKL